MKIVYRNARFNSTACNWNSRIDGLWLSSYLLGKQFKEILRFVIDKFHRFLEAYYYSRISFFFLLQEYQRATADKVKLQMAEEQKRLDAVMFSSYFSNLKKILDDLR